MLEKLLELAKRIGVTVKFLNNFKKGGCYLPEYDVIYIQEDLPEYRKIYALSHELAHAIQHKDYSASYSASSSNHSKMEYEADLNAIIFLVNHLEDIESMEPEQINFMYFMEQYNIDYSWEPRVKEALSNYIYHTKFV